MSVALGRLVAAALVAGGMVGVTARPAPAAVNLVQNGSFEDGYPSIVDGCGNGWYSVGSLPWCPATVPGWTAGNGGVDWHFQDKNPVPFDGDKAVDLNGGASGSLTQTVPTVPGSFYDLSFAYAAHPWCTVNQPWLGSSKSATASVAGSSVASVTATVADGWRVQTVRFEAASSSSAITFQSTSPGCGGVVLDDISVVATTVSDCKNGGWANFDGAFRNQGQCVSAHVPNI
jgi:hypothetical protein